MVLDDPRRYAARVVSFLPAFRWLPQTSFHGWFDVTDAAAPHSNLAPYRIGLRAARANLIPGLCVQAVMVTLVVVYYAVPSMRGAFDQLANFRQRRGIWFAIVSAALAGGVLPELLRIVFFQGGRWTRDNRASLVLGVLFWGFAGAYADGLYQLQAWMFGVRTDVGTIALKVVVDQFVSNVVWSAPVSTILYDWKNHGFRGPIGHYFTAAYYKSHVIPVLLATWGVWIPLVIIIYALPLALQVPIFSLALTFWVLLLTWMSEQQSRMPRILREAPAV
jgi:hypothetical protein